MTQVTHQPSSGSTGATRLLRLTKLEFLYLIRSKVAFALLAVFLVCGVASATGLVSDTEVKVFTFGKSLSEAEAHGGSLADALSRPLNVTEKEPGLTQVDNSLRYDYEQARTALANLKPLGFAINTLQVLLFFVLPPIGFLTAISLTTRDYRLHTLKTRCSRVPLSTIRNSQYLAALGALVLGCLVAVFTSIVAGLILAGSATGGTPLAESVSASTATWPELALSSSFAVALILFFCSIGWGAGLVIRQALIPTVAFVTWYFAVPVLGPLDPRNTVFTTSQQMLSFHGSVQLIPIQAPASALELSSFVGYLVVFVLAGILVSNRVSRYN